MPYPPGRRVDLAERLREVVAFLPVAFYFYLYWKRKDRLRTYARKSAFVLLIFSLALFLVELLMKAGGKHALFLTSINYPAWEPYVLGVFVLSGLIILSHNVHEVSQTRTQISLGNALWRLLYAPLSQSEAAIQQWLRLVHTMFAHHGCMSVCIWTTSASDDIQVCDDHWFPQRDADFLNRLPAGTGIAGLVLQDRTPRYVPRLFFPFNGAWLRRCSFRFPHALEFDVVDDQAGSIDVQGKTASMDAVEFGGKPVPDNLKSFIAVPVTADAQSVGKAPCHGVLCIAFKGTDPLDTDSIKMASLLGLVLASQLDRLAKQGPPDSGPI